MALHKKGLYNAANYPYIHTVTAQDQTDGYVTIDFQHDDRDIVWNVMVLDSSNVLVVLTGAIITTPADGQFRIATGGGYTITAGQIIHVQGMAYSSTAEYAS